jgi:glycyl-tRNA synthetase beta chain
MSRTLLLEIGCEELPTSFIRAGMDQLAKLVPAELERARITHGSVRTFGTPRRLAVTVEGVAEEVASRTEELLGPAESAAKGPDGKWTKAAEGFARKNDLALDALTIAETPKGRYLRAEKLHPGGKSIDRLSEVIANVLAKITFQKTMRWADIDTPFGRPVQWLVALFGRDVVPVTFVRVTAGRTTRGHRFLAPDPIDLADGSHYIDRLRERHVLADPDERRTAQFDALEKAAKQEGGDLVRNTFLEDEVLGLVEEPFAVVGHFDAGFLALPDELIETVMSHHQRYFAIRGRERLLPAFITTVNTARDPDTIRKGNESVMRARLADARFFVEQDRHTKLEARLPRLDGVVYHQKLGSYGDKMRRLEQLAAWVADAIGADQVQAARAARLAKADLVSLAVGEFPELQGVMGREYARHDGESEAVAKAIEEHYLPKGAEDDVAATKVGAAVAIADRLDTLVGFFAIGQKPSGAGDPFGLRRAALGLLRTLMHHRYHLSLATGAGRAYALYTKELPKSGDETGKELNDFIRERLEGLLVQKFPGDVVRACLASGHDDPVDVFERVEALAGLRSRPEFGKVVKAFERMFNISRQAPEGEADARYLTQPAEENLLEAWGRAQPQFDALLDRRDFVAALELVAESLPDPIDRFFTEVFVMDENPDLRGARLRLLARIAEEVGVIARFDQLS